MSWHQQQNPVILYHATKHTVVEEGVMQVVSRFTNQSDALTYLQNIKTKQPHLKPYYLPPENPQ